MKKLLSCAIAFCLVLSAVVCVSAGSSYTAVSIESDNGTVTMNPSYAAEGENVVLGFVPNEGYALAVLAVTDSKGNNIGLRDLGGGFYGFTMPASHISIRATTFETLEHASSNDKALPVFTDVPSGAYYETPVYWAVEKGIISGISDTLFGPDYYCSREDAINMIYTALGRPYAARVNLPFTDIDTSASYMDAINWCYVNGVVGGVTPTEFGTGELFTRAMLVTVLYRIMGSKIEISNPFYDVPAGSYFYYPVLWAYAMGFVNGVSPYEFAPYDCCTRAHMVTFIYRIFK